MPAQVASPPRPAAARRAAPCLVAAALTIGGAAPLFAAESIALEQSTTPSTCDTPQHHQFDFWLGSWQVFDAASNQLVAVDRIEKLAEGCIVEQSMTFVTDLYRRPGVKYRLAGIGLFRFDGAEWLQMWADNQWGSMVMTTVTPSRNRDVKEVWLKRSDGSVENLEYVAPAGSGKWQKYGDLIYRPNR
jgi:hypothetical protein